MTQTIKIVLAVSMIIAQQAAFCAAQSALENLNASTRTERMKAVLDLNERPIENKSEGIDRIFGAALEEKDGEIKALLFQAAFVQAFYLPGKISDGARESYRQAIFENLRRHEGALQFLAEQRDVSEDSLMALRAAFDSPSTFMQQAALRALIKYGVILEDQFFDRLLAYIEALPNDWHDNSPSSSNAWNAFMAAASLAERDRPTLIKKLIDIMGPDKKGGFAIEALGRIGPPASEALSRLETLAKDPSLPEPLRARVNKAIKQISGTDQ